MKRQRRVASAGLSDRRGFLTRALRVSSGAALALAGAPALVLADSRRPGIPFGVASGDVTGDRAVVWSRCDRTARGLHDLSGTELYGVDLDSEATQGD